MPHHSELTDFDIFYLEQHAAIKVYSERLRLQAAQDRAFHDMENQLALEKQLVAATTTNATQGGGNSSNIHPVVGTMAPATRKFASRY
ncbi:hypothetical protein HDU84_008024 [Entophlyctis sp. JEL0112]|nr:hypothetical protein HDU84_008024 [Entophlyctis sp. JEL0112]